MQFKHPEILWALLLLIIPILIHLFQLRKFKKTAFTNVVMLQKVFSESRKSNTLKKWLLLLCRLAILSCIILAFAQPFTANSLALKEKETVIYIDDSFSMEATNDGVSLLQKAIQEVLQHADRDEEISLFTNTLTYQNSKLSSLTNRLLNIKASAKQLNKEQIQLKANSLFTKSTTTEKQFIVISDFQEVINWNNTPLPGISTYLVPLKPTIQNNASIDSIYIDDKGNPNRYTLVFTGIPEGEQLPLSIYQNDTLISKLAAVGTSELKTNVTVDLPDKKELNAHAVLADNLLPYDNHFYFSKDATSKIKVMGISDGSDGFLKRIYTEDTFSFIGFTASDLNYSLIDEQHTIVLNNLKNIPSNLITSLTSFYKNGGSLVVIPPVKMPTEQYNKLLLPLEGISFTENILNTQKISNIQFKHPLYKNVFEKEVRNFDFPRVDSYYNLSSTTGTALAFDNGKPFLQVTDRLYVFTASLDEQNSNFTNAPLIVPTFFNIGFFSFPNQQLYFTVGENSNLAVNQANGNSIIKLSKGVNEIIPLQQSFAKYSLLNFKDAPERDGIYTLLIDKAPSGSISFNYDRTESALKYSATETYTNFKVIDSIENLFTALKAANNSTAYWKWFVIFALLFLLLEVGIQKFLS